VENYVVPSVGRVTIGAERARGARWMGVHMDDNVLRFEPRDRDDRQWSTNALDGGGVGRPSSGWSDGGGYTGHEEPPQSSRGELIKVVLLGHHLLAVERDPIEGSEYEHEVRELEAIGLRWRPEAPPPSVAPPVPPPHEQQLAWLACIVGGDEHLEALSTDPLPPEPLQLAGVPMHLRERVVAIAARFEPWVPTVLGDEGLTAARRLLVRAVSAEPGLLRSDHDDIAAGAVLWAVAKGNDLVGQNRPVRASIIQELAGLRSSPGQRGLAFAYAVGGVGSRYGRVDWMYGGQRPDVIPLGSPDLLLGRFRGRLVTTRDIALQLRARTPVAG
jgi:hypothetical protein